MSENTYEVYWEGPFTEKEIKANKNNEHWKLYAVYTPHPLYGANALVYIGMAKKGALNRIKSHSKRWLDQRNVGGEIFVASICRFTNWEKSRDWETYDGCLTDKHSKIINAIEALFIFGLQPAFNGTNKKSAPSAEGLRVFNTGKLGSIPYELSAKYHIG